MSTRTTCGPRPSRLPNGRLIPPQARIDLAAAWGGGLIASADGLRFVVPVATINAAPNPHYFGLRRGATWLNAVNDQYSGLGAIVIPGTLRDSMYILDLLLNLDGGQRPEMVVTDHASYSVIWTLPSGCCPNLRHSVRLGQGSSYADGVASSTGSLSSARSCSMRRSVP